MHSNSLRYVKSNTMSDTLRRTEAGTGGPVAPPIFNNIYNHSTHSSYQFNNNVTCMYGYLDDLREHITVCYSYTEHLFFKIFLGAYP